MVLATKSSSSSTKEAGNWGRGFLLVFFQEYPPNYKRKPSFSLSKSSINNLLLSKTQSTLSICALLLFTTLFFFTLFQPTTTTNHSSNRRVLRQNDENTLKLEPALQGMGRVFRRGSKAMTDLVVGHVAEGATEREITTFMRLIHHSGLLSRSDVVFIFDSLDSVTRLGRVVKHESESFLRLVELEVFRRYLDPGRVVVVKDNKESLWGKKNSNVTELTRASYGSVVGFDSAELDPEDSLSGFLDRVPMGLRRWACYPMLLGRVRRNYKHTMLLDVRNSLVLSDPFNPVRNRSAESVLVWRGSDTESTRSQHRGRNYGVGSGVVNLNSGVIIGGARGIRRFANAALPEIVRTVVEHKGKARNSVTESGLVNKLVQSRHLLKHIKVITSTESIPNTSSLIGLDLTSSGILAFADYFSVVQRGHGRVSIDIDSVVKSEICSSHELYSSVYRDCLATQ